MVGIELDSGLSAMDVTVRGKASSSLEEELPSSCKDAGVVTEVREQVGVSKRIAEFVPFAVIKG